MCQGDARLLWRMRNRFYNVLKTNYPRGNATKRKLLQDGKVFVRVISTTTRGTGELDEFWGLSQPRFFSFRGLC